MKTNRSWCVVFGAVACAGLVSPGQATEVPIVIASVASMDATPRDSESVLGFLRRYEATLASGRVDSIVNLYADFDPHQRPTLAAYFEQVVSDLSVRLDGVEVRVDGDTAVVEFDRTDSFDDRATGRHVEKSVSLRRNLQRAGRSWRIALDSR